ncbi:MAG: membrane protein [Alphaproteobacteria bacterium]|nr:MAG: membrane protein [Alphaproteobacteria bacterium]
MVAGVFVGRAAPAGAGTVATMTTQSALAKGQIAFAVAFALLIVGAVAMGASPIFVRHAEVGPFASAFWRAALALPVLWLWTAVEARAAPAAPAPRFPAAVVLSGLFFAGDLVFWHLAILNTTMANATLMACLAPVWVLILSGVFIGEPVDRRSFAGLAICLAGAALLIGSSYRVDPTRLIGDFYGLVTSVFFGLYFLAVRVARRRLGGGRLTLSSTIVTAAILFVVALISGNDLMPTTASGYASLAALGIVSQAGGQGMLAVALGALSAAFSSLVIFIEAVAAALFGWVLFGEAMGPMQMAGAALILTGIWVARPRQ